MTPYGSAWEEELALLFTALPPRIGGAAQRLAISRGDLLEVVLDLGREPEARFGDGEAILDARQITHADLEYVVAHVGAFGDDNRAGIERTLHRISALRNRSGVIIGLTCRVGRAVTGTIDILRDIIVNGQSVLLLGAPGIGKTTMLRECARVLADDCGKRVVIVDTSNEIGGDGDIPHPGIGRARRMQVKTPPMQHAVMIEAVENHMPQVIVIDEIGTELEAAAARTIAERGVQLIGTAHGTSLENLLVNPVLNDLLGGIQSVTLSDEEARRRGTQKSVLERKAPPTFDALVEIQRRDRVVVHMPLNETVDDALRGRAKPPQLRERGDTGEIVSRIDPGSATRSQIFDTNGFDAGRRGGAANGAGHGNGAASGLRRRERDRDYVAAREPRRPSFRVGGRAEPHDEPQPEPPSHGASAFRANQPIAVFPYGVSRTYLEQSIRDLRMPIRIQHNIDDADIVLTLKNYYRRKDSPVRMAEAAGIPIHVLRSNTVTQVKGALSRLYGDAATQHLADPTDDALEEAREAISRTQDTGEPVELAPRNAYIRRLQHQLVERNDLVARSIGTDPGRRLMILGRE